MFRTSLPLIKEYGYVFIDIYKPDSFIFLNNRILLFKADVQNITDTIIKSDKIYTRKIIPSNGIQNIFVTFTKDSIINIPIFAGVRFVEQCYIKVFIYCQKNICLKTFKEIIITKDTEQIIGIGESFGSVNINSSDYYVALEIPHPYDFELFPVYDVDEVNNDNNGKLSS